MKQRLALQTLVLSVAWLLLQNFNVPVDSPTNAGKGNYKIKKVVLDAGHGGKDPGCLGATSKEKHNALAIVLQLGSLIEAEFPDIEVIYTRETDVFVELNERAAIANRNNADLFISVHCNAMSKASAHGAETYVMGLHTAQHNLEVAKRENASIFLEDDYEKNYEGYDPNSPEAHILGSVWQSAYLEQSILFASQVQEQAELIGGRQNRGVKQAGFLVLRETAMPSALIEVGYLTNAEEEAYIASEEGQAAMATAIFEAFRGYKSQMEGPTDEVVGPPKPKPGKTSSSSSQAGAKPGPQAPGKNAATPPRTGTGSKTSAGSTAGVQKQAAQKNNTPAATVKKQPVKNPVKEAAESSFRIFLLGSASKLDVNSGKLSLLNGVEVEKTASEYQYFVGTFASKEEAESLLPELKNLGFKNAAIVKRSSKQQVSN